VINNLAIRRAVQELKAASDFEQLRSILIAAFEGNDFDAFELQVKPLPGDLAEPESPSLHWSKFPNVLSFAGLASWKLSLDLVTTSNRRRGSLVIHRLYSQRDLQLDVNLVTSEFPLVLADTVDRLLAMPQVLPAEAPSSVQLLAANG
jgi:hypothetical protein